MKSPHLWWFHLHRSIVPINTCIHKCCLHNRHEITCNCLNALVIPTPMNYLLDSASICLQIVHCIYIFFFFHFMYLLHLFISSCKHIEMKYEILQRQWNKQDARITVKCSSQLGTLKGAKQMQKQKQKKKERK